MAGSSTADAPAFFFDLASPAAYVAAERALQSHPGVEWVPILARELPSAESWEAFRCAEERNIALAHIERTAAEQGLQPVRWPDPFPFDSRFAMRVATYAKQIGRTVPFALAAYRQAFAAGRSGRNRRDDRPARSNRCPAGHSEQIRLGEWIPERALKRSTARTEPGTHQRS
jgi:2-hydroxychromene-2-carboxylate isomerase